MLREKLHSAWVIFAAGCITMACSAVAIVAGIFNPYSEFMNNLIRFWGRMMLRVSGIRIEVVGQKNLDPEQPYIFVSNHQSTLDIPASVVAIPGTARFIAKKELFRIPLFAQGMRLAGIIPIDRGNSKKARATIDHAIDVVKKGVSVIIYPEGTRSRDGTIKPFKKGAFILALKGQIPVVPTVISGSANLMKKKSLRTHRGIIRMEFLPPVKPNNTGYEQRQDFVQNVRQQIIEHYDPNLNKVK